MRWFALFAAPLLVAAIEPPRELLQAVHAGGTTWLLREGGQLSRLDDDAAAPLAVAVPIRALALCHVRGALTLAARGGAGWQVLQRHGGVWHARLATPALARERYIGAACGRDGVTVLTDRRMIDQRRGVVPLTGYTPSMSIRTVVYRDADALLVGTNAGEWGGRLLRIPLSTGRVEEVPGADAPIHDIAPAPGKPGCVVLAIGLVHFFPSGKLTEVCGRTARRLYARPKDFEGLGPRRVRPGEDPYPSVAFYGLAPAKDGSLRAIGMDGLYRIARDGSVSGPRPLPAFVSRGDVRIARVAPDLDLVLTGVNGRASLGGAMPIAVPR